MFPFLLARSISRPSTPFLLWVVPLLDKGEGSRSKSSTHDSSKAKQKNGETKNKNSKPQGDLRDVQQPSPLLDWNASGSIGSLLMQMQRREEEMKKLNQTMLFEQQMDQALDLSSSSSSSNSADLPPPKERQVEIQKMAFATAKELDDSVTYLPDGYDSLDDSAILLELPSLYTILANNPKMEDRATMLEQDFVLDKEKELPAMPLPVMPLSKPEHYRDRMGRDMRHLAVSIASSVEDAAQWRLFCQQQRSGGLMPLVECIHEGARLMREQQAGRRSASATAMDLLDDDHAPQFTKLLQQHSYYEESFLAASSACRVLRDLCAISPEMSAVMTDGLLRANIAYSKQGDFPSSLMTDFCTMLNCAQENNEFDAKQRGWRANRFQKKNSSNRTNNRRRKRGETSATRASARCTLDILFEHFFMFSRLPFHPLIRKLDILTLHFLFVFPPSRP
jgi:hypothetical protein